MTKVQIRFRIEKPLGDALLKRIADAHSIYGILWVRLDPSTTGLTIEYDATRLRPAEIEAALENAGIAVARN